MPKNYYIILGISSNSSHDDIKAAYRRLAKKFHPDYYGTNNTPFQAIQEAYSVLGNPRSRKAYDTSLQPAPRTSPESVFIRRNTRLHEEVEPLIPEDEPVGTRKTAVDTAFNHQWSLFDSMFERFLHGFVEQRQQRLMKNRRDLTIEISLSAQQARTGGNVRVSLPIQMHCPTCSKKFAEPYSCWRCNGTGILQGEKTVVINYPPGIRDNHTTQPAISAFGGKPLCINAIFKIR